MGKRAHLFLGLDVWIAHGDVKLAARAIALIRGSAVESLLVVEGAVARLEEAKFDWA